MYFIFDLPLYWISIPFAVSSSAELSVWVIETSSLVTAPSKAEVISVSFNSIVTIPSAVKFSYKSSEITAPGEAVV